MFKSYNAKIRFVVFCSEDPDTCSQNSLELDTSGTDVFESGFRFRNPDMQDTVDMIEEELNECNITELIEPILKNTKILMRIYGEKKYKNYCLSPIYMETSHFIPGQFYEIIGDAVLDISSWYDYEGFPDCDAEFHIGDGRINMIEFRDAKKFGFDYGWPIPVQCA